MPRPTQPTRPARLPILAASLLALALVAAGCGHAIDLTPHRGGAPHKEDIAPESATGFRHIAPVTGQHTMVIAATPDATRAGQAMLDQGGSAVDAAIAMALVLTLTEPQSSGIGGGAFMLVFDPKTGQPTGYDGRETAPSSATPTMFLDAKGHKLPFWTAVIGGRSVGIPGILRAFEMAHKDHGKLPWRALFQPAIQLATHGFIISPRLHALLKAYPFPPEMTAGRAYFHLPGGAPKPVGARLKNPALAHTLTLIADRGAAAFYGGDIARDIITQVQDAPHNPTKLRLEDFSSYRAKVRKPVCLTYRARWEICGFAPPTSGGIAPLQILGILEQRPIRHLDPDGPAFLHLFAEASRLAFADRDLYVADPDFETVPGGLLDNAYLKSRARLINTAHTMGPASAGQPPSVSVKPAPDASPELPCTTHIVAVDASGQAVSMTASIESAFGSRIMVRGFLLNNELTDFSFLPSRDGRPVKNRIAPGKRPRSSMSPLLVLGGGPGQRHLVAALGSPGGSRIIDYVALALIRVLDFGMSMQEAFRHPNVINRNGPTELETLPGWEAWAQKTQAALQGLGHTVIQRELNSGLHGFVRRHDQWEGGVDPRREGLAIGR